MVLIPHLQVALRSLPEETVKETLEYKVLQSQFSLLYNESLQVKTQLDEARALLLTTKNSHLRHIEHMEVRERTGHPCVQRCPPCKIIVVWGLSFALRHVIKKSLNFNANTLWAGA